MKEDKISKADIKEVVKEVFNIVENEEREKESLRLKREINEHLKEIDRIDNKRKYYLVGFGLSVGLFIGYLLGGYNGGLI
jgi:flagellar basal body P-ring protein FlgI